MTPQQIDNYETRLNKAAHLLDRIKWRSGQAIRTKERIESNFYGSFLNLLGKHKRQLSINGSMLEILETEFKNIIEL